VTTTISVGSYAWGVDVSPDGKFAYVPNSGSNNVSVIDTSTNTVTATISVGNYPYGVDVSPDGKFVYVTNSADGTVSVIDTSTNTVTATVSVGLGPFAFGKFIGPAPKGTAPIANVGSDQTVNEGNLVSLDGSGSRSLDGGTLTYNWSQVAGPAVTLNLTDPVHPTFVAPHVPLGGATLTFELIVTEGDMTSDPAVVNIVVKHVNHPPVADAGSDQTVQEGSPVTLDGSNSYDPDSDTITYSWAQTAGPSITLSDPTAV
jgi:YVTN family beta-propeller protein